MQKDKALREHLVQLLKGGNAHADFETAIKDLPPNLRGKTPKNAGHSPWQLLEHMRIAQWDILEFVRNPDHVSPEFPKGYWPKSQTPPDKEAWDKSAKAFRGDHKALIKLVENEPTDLLARIPHGDGQTVLREVLLAADHTAYHLGALVLVRRFLGAWHE
ncbi:MAG TPA: DinB family protein [Acidobacteriaceae bacterium]